jgi:NAD(P)-dependent dehydrogenase (short-subunit alcohol dehydrogenase family)
MTAPDSSKVHFGHDGRVVIVTGGAQGIGEACARRFAREGARVVLADVADARGQALAAELGASYVHCDVGDKAQVDALVAQVAGARAHRRAGQQRRHLQGRGLPGRDRSRLRRRDRAST